MQRALRRRLWPETILEIRAPSREPDNLARRTPLGTSYTDETGVFAERAVHAWFVGIDLCACHRAECPCRVTPRPYRTRLHPILAL